MVWEPEREREKKNCKKNSIVTYRPRRKLCQTDPSTDGHTQP